MARRKMLNKNVSRKVFKRGQKKHVKNKPNLFMRGGIRF